MSSFGSYPNPLNITDDDRRMFHPVVKFPDAVVRVVDSTVPAEVSGERGLATDAERESIRRRIGEAGDGDDAAPEAAVAAVKDRRPHTTHYVGPYDENRDGMYESDLFHDVTNDVDGYDGKRTLHVGVDLGGPVGTEVYAFYHGVIHSVGYNPQLGDYGNVIVVRHHLPTLEEQLQQQREQQQQQEPSVEADDHLQDDNAEDRRLVYALYGHLDDASIVDKKAGQTIRRGQLLGRFGDIHENGGWFSPHVHFQLSINPPSTHDMPGAVSMHQRSMALVEYPDPRYVLGPLY